MASDDNMTIHSSMHEDEDDDEHHHGHNLSRLSICSSKHSMIDFEDGSGGCTGGDMMMMYMSGLSVESSDGEGGEADEELSEEEDDKRRGVNMYGGFSDSDKGLIGGSCLSLPGTPLQQIHQGYTVDDNNTNKDYYCSENEGGVGSKGIMRSKKKRNSRRRAVRERWLDIEWEKKKYIAKVMDGESDHASVLRNGSLCIDLEEVKACRDLGFEPEIPSQFSCSTIDTASSGGNSPIANWRISSPGDDPKDVKARLKVWAQAVATSASRLVG
ncbi:hypothetical protein ACHQM5_025876 [Ranunculus cassubicifolius]